MNKPIGRRTAALKEVVDGESKEFTLDSGETALFELKKISFDDLSNNSFVDERVNGREQEGLTDNSLEEISSTISSQQYYSTYVVLGDDGRYEFIDGSRRRMSAINNEVGLEAYVTEDELKLSDKIMLAHNLQTAKEHSYREKGIKIQNYLNVTQLEQKDAAAKFGHSEATITRLLKAASVSSDLIGVFTDRNTLKLSDYSILSKVDAFLSKEGISLEFHLKSYSNEIEAINESDLSVKDQTENIISLLSASIKESVAPKPKVESITTPLVTFKDKNKYAKTITKGDKVSIEMKGLPDELVNEVQELIKNRLSK